MPAPDTAFNGVADQFAGYGSDLRGYVRYEVAHQNLKPYVAEGPLNIADIGSGAAIDGLWLASLGHQVTLVEPSKKQMAKAQDAIAAAPSDTAERITMVLGTTQDLLANGQENEFDMVLSHGVAMYLSDPGSFIGELVRLTKPAGKISLLEKGFYGAEARMIHEENWTGLRILQRTHKVPKNNMGYEVYAFMPAELEQLLKKAGAKTLSWSGVRVITDEMKMPVHALEPDMLAAIVDVEHKQGARQGIRETGQMLHFIAEKR